MNFAETMQSNPPRLVVMFQHGQDGSEQFQWGVVGSIPVLTLLGGIAQVQIDLLSGEWMPECESDPPGNHPPSLVLTWDAENRVLSHFKHPEIPSYPLVGMLETIKFTLVGSRVAQHSASQKVQLLGPNGQPMRY